MYCRRSIYNDFHTHYPYRHHGVNVYSSCEIPDTLPIVDVSPCSYRRASSCYNYPCYDYVSPPIIQTNLGCYCDDPCIEYDDAHRNACRLSRPRIVDYAPRHRIRNYNRTVVSTLQPERIIVPRTTVVRHTSLPRHIRPRRTRLMPLYHTTSSQCIVTYR